jgi:hypothetical protein
MTAYAIEKNIPLPANSTRTMVRYPYAKMSVGDSFAVTIDPYTEANQKRVMARIMASAYYFCKGKYAGRFTIRKIKGEGVIRVWRTGL